VTSTSTAPRPAPGLSDEDVGRFGYRQPARRTLRAFTSFAVGFSFISITSGTFASYGFVLNTSGPRGIFNWLIAGAGQILVALIFMAFAARIPLAGYSYQWASRIVGPRIGWAFGWLCYAFLAVVVVAVDYGFATQAFMPLFDIEVTTSSAQVVTVLTLVAQAIFIIASTRLTALVNGAAVGAEIAGMLGLTVVLLVAVAITGDGSVSNLTSSGIVDDGAGSGYWAYNGPFMLAILIGAYTIVGFESAANLAEETEHPTRVVPPAMFRAVTASVVIGFIFLVALTLAVPDVAAISKEASPVAAVIDAQLGGTFGRVFLAFVVVAIFANGLVIMMSGSRLVFAMSRDRRFPGHQLFGRVSHSTGTPIWATLLILAGGVIFTLVFKTDALVKLFTAGTILPALIYLVTVLLYIAARRRLRALPTTFDLGRWEIPVVVGALAWLVFELTVLTLPSEFFDPVKLVGVMLVIGVVVYAALYAADRHAFAAEPGDPLDALPSSPPVPSEAS
jgi:amino acid transporter